MPPKYPRRPPAKKKPARHPGDKFARRPKNQSATPTSRSSSAERATFVSTASVPEIDSRTLPGGISGLPVVGIGASAGGLEAFSHLLKSLPSDTGLVFVYVQHLDPTHESILSDLFSKS